MRSFVSILAATVTLTNVASSLDLTPVENWREQEGVRINTLIFNDTTGKIRYQPPADWRIHGDATTLSLYPPQQEAFMQFRLFPRTALKPGEVEDLAKWSLSFLPQDATNVAPTDEERPSPFTLSGRPSRELIYGYRSGAQRFQTAVAICDLNERERLVVIVTARAGDFPAVHEAGISSMFSWSKRK